MALPSGYKLLEYIESTGTQYIVTGLNSLTNYEQEVIFSDYKYVQKAGLLGSNSYFNSYTGYNNTLRWCMSDRCYDTPGSLTNKRSVKLGLNYLTVDNVSISQLSDSNGTPSSTVHTLFKGYNCASAKIYSYSASLNGQLLRCFVPCVRISDGAIGMYDLCGSASSFDGTPFYGNSGTGSFIAGPVAVPEMPEGLTASVNGACVTLTWSASNDATGYKISRNGVQIADQTALYFTDTVEHGQTYVYTVVAYNDSGDSEPAQLTVQTPPGAPTTLYQTMAVRLAWAAVSSTERYNIYRNGRLLGTTTELFFVDDTAAENTEYTYGVSAVNPGGASPQTVITIYTKSGYFLYKPLVESATFQ